jgi:CelD/BcsL family acetyltransferase involved in cellulose biosynthesis
VLSFPGGWRARIFTRWNFPRTVLKTWDDMALQCGDVGVFLESGWFEQWWSAMGRRGTLFVVIVEHGSEIRGVFPCWIAPGGRIQGLVDDFHYDFLIAPEQRSRTLACFVETIRRYGGSALFHNFPVSSDTPRALARTLWSRLVPAGLYAHAAAPYVPTSEETWTSYVDSLHSKLRNNLKKGRRRAEHDGTLLFEVVRRPESLDSLLDELFEVEARSWKGKQGTAIKSASETEKFYRAVARRAMDQDSLFIFTLRLNDAVIAFDLCVAGATTMFALKTGYDQSVASRFSPGNLMRFRVLEFLFQEQQFRSYDFLGPSYPWKLEWTALTNTATSLEVYPRSLAGWARYMRKYGWKAPLKRAKPLLTVARERAMNIRRKIAR